MDILSESDRQEWYPVGNLSNEVGSLITEFKKGHSTDEDILYIKKSVIVFLESVLEAEKKVRKGEKVLLGACIKNLTNGKMFVEGWIKSGLPFSKNDEEYIKEVKSFITCFETMAQGKQPDKTSLDKIEKLFDFLGDLALRKVHKSSLMSRP
ncbi:MAG: hypothetical protein UT90_C0005G0018 [Parcubacteria group bacterium GW2011_GWA1_40_21]|nr:MAG: hypothetical protein UT80_C0051G0002 [Parcubacteria group bacterium GW2011_GWC1_40_13]KKR53711.1 MAG: hypothetical protein UT90_C0005G0018 [Parcubacteria group bacterium GW2011_GWA1_40_21]